MPPRFILNKLAQIFWSIAARAGNQFYAIHVPVHLANELHTCNYGVKIGTLRIVPFGKVMEVDVGPIARVV